MKNNYILLALLLSSFFSFSQTLTVNSSANVIDPNGNKWTVTEVRDILYSNPKALERYNIGREKKTWGNVLLYGGLGVTATSLIYNSTQDVNAQFGTTILGLAMVVVGIPVKIGHSKRVKKAIEMYNESLDGKTASTPIKVTLIASQNQLGLKYAF